MSGEILIFVCVLTEGPRLCPVLRSHWRSAPAWGRSLTYGNFRIQIIICSSYNHFVYYVELLLYYL